MKNDVNRIKSFEINHDLLEPGFYISRIDSDVVTYDLRTRKPNAGNYMSNIAMHSVEHMFATLIRNSEIADSVVYFGPMGCQTGFYLLVRDNISSEKVFEITKSVLSDVIDYDGPVFGASARECGNYRNLSLDEAKIECKKYLLILESGMNNDFTYPEDKENVK